MTGGDERRQQGGMSDGEIVVRLDTITARLDTITTDIHEWRSEFVPAAVYQADERTRAEIRKQHDDKDEQLAKKDDELGLEITNLQAEATRRAREKRTMWAGIVAAIISAVLAGMFGYFNANHTVTVCVPANEQTTTQVVCK